MRVVYHRLAEEEVIEAAKYYDRRSPGPGSQFLDAIDETARRIGTNPEGFEVAQDDVCRATVKRFPYPIFFRRAIDVVRILAIKHHSRNTTYWKRRRQALSKDAD